MTHYLTQRLFDGIATALAMMPLVMVVYLSVEAYEQHIADQKHKAAECYQQMQYHPPRQ